MEKKVLTDFCIGFSKENKDIQPWNVFWARILVSVVVEWDLPASWVAWIKVLVTERQAWYS